MGEANLPTMAPGTQHVTPNPDPTTLTTAQILREIGMLSAIVEEKIASLTQRLDAMDKAQVLFHENLTRVPTEVDKAIAHLKELHEAWVKEKFVGVQARLESIQVQFMERDTRTEQMARSSEAALTAALNAAKDAVAQQHIAHAQATSKSEAGFIKQIDQLVALFQSGIRALDDKIAAASKTSDDKVANIERQLTMLVGSTTGVSTEQMQQQRSHSNMTALVGLVVMGLLTVGSLIVAVIKVTQ